VGLLSIKRIAQGSGFETQVGRQIFLDWHSCFFTVYLVPGSILAQDYSESDADDTDFEEDEDKDDDEMDIF